MLIFFGITAIKALVVIIGLMTGFAYITWLERRLISRFQVRVGPNRVGPAGLLQPLADGLKLFFKEDFVPTGADKTVYYIAPAISMIAALVAFTVIPFGPVDCAEGQFCKIFDVPLFQVAGPNSGILFILAISSLGAYGIILAGWSSNSKYSILGSLRSSAQLISYELAVGLTIVGVILMAGTLDLGQIVAQQEGTYFGFLPRWNIFCTTSWIYFVNHRNHG